MSISQRDFQEGFVQANFTLEFRTWTGSAYEWRDYTRYLYGFGDVGVQVEENAYPHAFKLKFSSVELDNRDGFFNDLDDIDPYLTNTAEPYGKKLYKRMLRLSQVRSGKAGTGATTVVAVAIVRDASYSPDGIFVRLLLMSLDARASDQGADSELIERHPAGSDNASSPSQWTATNPASDSAEVALYRWREKEDSRDTYQCGFFKFRRIPDIIERTCWALDDLSYDIEDEVMYTSDGREVVSVRNVPPDNSLISTGIGDNRTRAIVWNPRRNVLVCCVGHRVYDYDPTTNTYTLRNTLNSGRQIVRAWYIDEADSSANQYRIVLIAYDVTAYPPVSSYGILTYLTVLDATGSGSYTAIVNQQILNSDLFPGSHFMRKGLEHAGPDLGIGHYAVATWGENILQLFRQSIDATVPHSSAVCETQSAYPNKNGIFVSDMSGAPVTLPAIFDRGYGAFNLLGTGTITWAGLSYSIGQIPIGCITFDAAGGKLWYVTHTSGSGFRLRHLSLYDYSTAAYVSYTDTDYMSLFLFCPPKGDANDHFVYSCHMDWDDSVSDYSNCRVEKYDVPGASWNNVAWLNGAATSNQAWTCVEIVKSGGTHPGIMFNRETQKWAITSDVGGSWATTEAAIEYITDNKLMGLHLNTNYSPDRLYFVEFGYTPGGGHGGAHLLYWDGTNIVHANKAPDGAPWPINTDLGLYCYMVHTQVNYPDANTPMGMMFGVSANDFGDTATNHQSGEYCLWQYANFLSLFVKLLDVRGLSVHELRNKLAEAIGFVHYYDYDGTFIFKKRARPTGSPDFAFSAANRNYDSATLKSTGWESIINDVTIIPSDIQYAEKTSEITRGETGSETDGLLTDVSIAANPGEKAQWRVVMVGPALYDIYKLVGSGASSTTPKATGKSIDAVVRGGDITDGAYLSFYPNFFSGTFARGDNFTFWVFEPEETLETLSDRDKVVALAPTSIAEYKRAKSSYQNRYVNKFLAPDFMAAVLEYRKDPHPVIEIVGPHDPAYRPLLTLTIIDSGLPFTVGDEFYISGIKINAREGQCTITAVKL